MAGLSLSQAAKMTGRSKSTIGRALKAGRLSGIQNDDGTFSIDPSELFRVFPRGGPETAGTGTYETMRNPQSGMIGTDTEAEEIKALRDDLAKAQQRAAAAEAKAEERAGTIADLRARLDQEGEERRKLTALLTDQRSSMVNPVPAPATANRLAQPRWWFWR